MSVARHHAEWLSLIEVSGPFLSMPVLMRVFPQELDPRDAEKAKELRLAYEEWVDKPNAPGRHRAWIEFVLSRLLEFPKDLIAEGQSLPTGLDVGMAEYGETLRPDLAIVSPDGTMSAGKAQMVVQIYPVSQILDSPVSGKHWKAAPSTRMMELLHASDVPLGLVTNGEQWMFVYAPRGETTGYTSWYAALWQEEPLTLRAFHSLLHCRRFFGVAESDTLTALLKESYKDQQEVTNQLGYQVRRAVEVLIQAFDRLDADSGRRLLKGVDEKTLYDAALTVMMRLVFLFSAEERRLLRLGEPLYDENYAVSTMREQLRELADQHGEEVLERRFDAWSRLLATFRAVHGGIEHETMRLPAYGGTLFDPDRYPFLEGRPQGTRWKETSADPLAINNRVVLHLLESLQILQVKVPGGGPAEARRLSFRALDIEQIGHVYEGLLDHGALRAESTVLGLKGSGGEESEIPLEKLEGLLTASEDKLVKFLKEETSRSENALRRALKEKEIVDEHKLLITCGQDMRLRDRILPFASLLRGDSFGMPAVILQDSIYVTQSATRRSTGTHYTPRSLTEPIVQHTLEPLVYEGPSEGWPKEKWKLRTPKEILALKLCDMAMGSGAFLVQACRYLAERLVEAWENLEQTHPASLITVPYGELSTGSVTERLIPKEVDERIAVARRAIADRCLYGVDINPMAVEMAKLSLWLITVQKDRPFTFLDHALKCGDSLLGINNLKQLENFSLRPGETQITFSTASLPQQIKEASAKRQKLEGMSSDNLLEIEAKNILHTEAEAAVAKLKCAADILISIELRGLSGEPYESAREIAARQIQLYWTKKSLTEFQHFAQQCLQSRGTFHWPLEFPEVFDQGGIDAFVGNPPFRGGLMITKDFDLSYTLHLKAITSNAGTTTDLCAYFFRRAYELIRQNAGFGLLATNSICEGDTRETSLSTITNEGGTITNAVKSMPWPGSSALHVALVHIWKGTWKGEVILDDVPVANIGPSLSPDESFNRPYSLSKVIPAFLGTTVYGSGFFLTEAEAQKLLQSDPSNASVIKRFLNGDDVLKSPKPKPSRYVLCFQGLSLDEAKQFQTAFSIALERVFPERQKSPAKGRRERWWLYTSPAEDLYDSIKNLKFVFVTCFTSKYVVFTQMNCDMIFSNAVIVVASDDFACFPGLQSSFHESWVREFSSTLETRQRYALSDCYETFVQPIPSENLRNIGRKYCEHRAGAMLHFNQGLTDIYNRFHDPNEDSDKILKLRVLHVEMDQTVSAAYGWSDLDLGHSFHETKQGVRYTISESARRIVLDRLLQLNHQRYEEEVKAGLHEKKAKSKGTGAKRSRKSKSESSENKLTLF